MNEIQKRILLIYKEIKKVCDLHRIEFFSIGGTAIGSIRHHGFIPWDDDIDITIKIEDFDNFINVCRAELPSWLEVFIPGETSHLGLPYIKIMDNRTMMTCSAEMPYKDCYTGVFVDVMVLYGMPRHFKQLGRHIIKMGYLMRAQSIVKLQFPSKLPIPHFLLWFATRPVAWFRAKDYYWRKYVKFLHSNNVDNSKYVAYTGGNYVLPRQWFASAKEVPFEDTVMKVPVCYNEYLTMIFGDYMQLPPEENRIPAHIDNGGILDLNKSYKEYAESK